MPEPGLGPPSERRPDEGPRGTLRTRFTAGLAGQLARPQGVRGHLVATMLNRRNGRTVASAVALLGPRDGEVVADVGFGGGVSLKLLLEAVGPRGSVVGVDISPVAVARARRRFGREISAGRLRLHQASLTALPVADATLAGLMTVNTLYFVDDLGAALSDMARAVAPDGRVVVGLGDPGVMAGMPVTRHGFRVRPIAEVVDALSDVGLGVSDHQRVGEGDGAYHLLLARHEARHNSPAEDK